MVTIDTMRSLEDLDHVNACKKVNSFQEGADAAIAYFKQIHIENVPGKVWDDDMVDFYGPKIFKTYNEEDDIRIITTVYECYIDSGSEDYFFFSYEIQIAKNN